MCGLWTASLSRKTSFKLVFKVYVRLITFSLAVLVEHSSSSYGIKAQFHILNFAISCFLISDRSQKNSCRVTSCLYQPSCGGAQHVFTVEEHHTYNQPTDDWTISVTSHAFKYPTPQQVYDVTSIFMEFQFF